MNILLINSHNTGGVEYYRALKPNHVLSKLHPEFKFTSFNGFPINEMTGKMNGEDIVIGDDFLKGFELIIFIRTIGNNLDEQAKIVEKLNKLGIKFGLDLDDFWRLDSRHLLYNIYKQNKTSELVTSSIKVAHFITTTTPYLRDEIVKLNKNCYIIENGIDIEDDSWQKQSTELDLLRFGLMLGTTHLSDLLSIKSSLHNCLDKLKDIQVINSGFSFDLEGNRIPLVYESIITDEYKKLRFIKGYKEYLFTGLNDNDIEKDKPYRRQWVVGVDDWGKCYDNIDISLVPLVANHFNSCKSELKLIEAGVKGKTAIVSYVKPYDLLATEDNSYIVDSSTTFYLQMKRAKENPNEVKDKSEQLNKDVLDKYTLQKLTPKRKQVYEIFR